MNQSLFSFIGEGMPIISINKIMPLMKLGEPVKNISGQLLLNKGAVITESDIETLKAWGINEVPVEGDEQKPQQEKLMTISPEMLSDAKFKTQKLFRHANPNHSAMRMLTRLVILNNFEE